MIAIGSQGATRFSVSVAAVIVLAVLLVAVLTPRFAYAAAPSEKATTSELTTAEAVTSSSKTTTVKVITYKQYGSYYGNNQSYTYNSNGLLTKANIREDDYNVAVTFGYNERGDVTSYNLKCNYGTSMTQNSNAKVTVSRNKVGLPTKRVVKYTGPRRDTSTTAYTVKSGKVTAAATKVKAKGQKKATLFGTYAYSYKDGRLFKEAGKHSYTKSNGKVGYHKYAITYAYDSNGNAIAKKRNGMAYGRIDDVTFKIGSKANLEGSEFKEIEVPSAYAAKVEAQQWALLNNNLNFTF